jgi:hypothetical protein
MAPRKGKKHHTRFACTKQESAPTQEDLLIKYKFGRPSIVFFKIMTNSDSFYRHLGFSQILALFLPQFSSNFSPSGRKAIPKTRRDSKINLT